MLKPHYIFPVLFLGTLFSCRKPVPVQTNLPVQASPLVEVGPEKFSPTEFLSSYEKNKFANDSVKPVSPEEYLKIYTDEKMKVLQAKNIGKDTAKNYQEEIKAYTDQLAKNFLVDKSLVEKLSTEAYNRLKTEVRASHILIEVAEDASPADTLEAYRAAIALRGRLEEGSDFSDMATRFSKDISAKTNKGDLGYFTAFQMVYPFENAAYTLPVGKISQPVRSKSGYHLIKVTDKRNNRGMVTIAHIMIRLDSTSTPVQKELAKTAINEAYTKLQNGMNWDAAVLAYSNDMQSKKRQGLLPRFGTGEMVHEIEDAAFSLSKPGSYSKPVLSMYGWHIVKLVEKKGIETYENMAPSLRQKVVTDTRGKIIEQANAKRLRKTIEFEEFPEAFKQVAVLGDSSILTGKWDYARAVAADWSTLKLFTIHQKPYYALQFLNEIKRIQKPKAKGSSPAVVFKKYYNDYLNSRLAKYEREHLEETNPEFKSQITEIKDGVLLSQMMEDNVWQKSLSDSVGQVRFYEKTKSSYPMPERMRALLISAKDTQTINAVRKAMAQKPYRLEKKATELLYAEGINELSPQQTEDLYDVYATLQKNPEYTIEIAGFRSSKEPEAVSAARIKNVVKYLSSKNIPIHRIIEKDYSSFRPSMEPARNHRIAFQFFSNSTKDLEKAYSENLNQEVVIRDGYFTKESSFVKNLQWKAGEQTISQSGKSTWIHVNAIEPARLKTFMEARGSVINAYQKELEKQWMSGLHQKYPVKVNAEELEKIKR